MKRLINKLILLFACILLVPLIAFQPQQEKTAAEMVADKAAFDRLTNDEQMKLLADLYVEIEEQEQLLQQAAENKKKREMIDAQQKAKDEARAKKLEAEAKLKTAEEDRQREEQKALAKARADLEASIASQRLEQLLDKIFISFRDLKPWALEYFCTQTLEALYNKVDQIDTAQAADLSRSYSVGINDMYELQARVRNALMKEREKRTKNDIASFKSLIYKAIRPPITVTFLTFKELQDKLNAIELLQNDRLQKECWIAELQLANLEQLESSLKRLKSALQQTVDQVNTLVQQDLKKAEQERKEELSESALMRQALQNKQVAESIKKLEELRNKFPAFFKGIPAELQLKFLNEYEKIYANRSSIDEVLTELYSKAPVSRIISQRLIALGMALGLEAYAHAGYVYFNNGPQKETNVIVLPKYIDIQGKLGWAREQEEAKRLQKEVDEAAQNLVNTYKIHLMPADSLDQIDTLLKIEAALRSNSDLSSAIRKFKIVMHPYQQKDELTGQPIIFPKVVIYAFGKPNAQTILDEVYKSLENKIPGLNVRPRYNAKVTDLIWIAQGDGDYKGDRYASYYENPFAQIGRIYYRKDITGKDQNYHLIHPGIKKEIVS